MRRIESLLLAFVLLAALAPAGPAVAAAAAVSGTILTKDAVALTPAAIAVVTIVDQEATGSAGSIIGQQRIDGAALPVSFSVAYDAGATDAGRSYALFASIVDGGTTYQSVEPVPVITGGPTSGITVHVAPVPAGAGRVTGTMVRNDRSALSAEAVAIAALIRQDTGTLVARQVIPSPGSGDIAFAIPYDPGIIDPTAPYVVRGGIVDGGRHWVAAEPVPAIVNGAVVGSVTVPLTQAGGPTPEPTAEPTATPEPTAAPMASPAPTPTASPTASPTPTASPSPRPTAKPAPEVGVIRGEMSYGEDHELTTDAHAVVVLVEGAGGPLAGTIIATQDIEDPGGKPVAFELLYPLDATTPGTAYTLWAGITDGDLAWATPTGVTVKAPWPLTEGVDLPLEFRPDLLKAAVSGTITGIGLDSDNPAAYGTALVHRVDTGETIGFQVIAPTGPTPLAFSVPYDPDALDDDADYVVSGSVFDGSDRWSTVTSVPVITRGNAKSGVVLAVTPVPEPTPAPTPSPEASPAPEPVPADDGGPGILAILVALGLIAVGGAGLVAYLRSRKAA